MAEEHFLLKATAVVGTLIPIGGALIALGIYVGNLNNEIQASRSEVQVLKGQVTQLQDILQKTQSTLATVGSGGTQGPKGDQGPRGPVGPQGPEGPSGPKGDTPSLSEIEALVARVVKASQSNSTGSNINAVKMVDASGTFDLSGCLSDSAIKAVKSFSLTKGQEICNNDGALLTHVDGVGDDKTIHFNNPGTGAWYCAYGWECTFDWLKTRKFYVERTSEKDGKIYALLRFKD